MRELFRERDVSQIHFYQVFLEDKGIPTFIRNENLSSTEISIPEFFPALCLVKHEDYEPAAALIREHLIEVKKSAEVEIACRECDEVSPGNFETCWSCGSELEL